MASPDEVERDAPRPLKGRKVALGLDLGTRCGYACTVFTPGKPFDLDRSGCLYIGQWDLSAGDYDSGAIRFVRLRQMLAALNPDIVFYEEPRFSPPAGLSARGVAAVLGRAMTSAEFLGGLKTTLCTWCEEARVPCLAYPIGSIKKFATGKGNAGKPEMIAAANAHVRPQPPLEAEGYEQTGADNMADATWALLLGLSEHALGA